jgi:putative membrane protein insertion efficiency factor
VIATARRAAWVLGWPARAALLVLIGSYRLTLGRVIGGACRFYPSCSAYAEAAIRQVGAVRGTALAVWRVLRCSPLSAGGVDHPPTGPRPRGGGAYEALIHAKAEAR